MKKMLKKLGYKVTPARLAILDVLKESKVPVTAEDIYYKILENQNWKDINKTTVYRTIAFLQKENILARIDWRKDAVLFELNDKHHHHITCLNCDAVEDFENKEIEALLEKIGHNSRKFISINDHSLELFGLCKKCI